MPRVFYCLFTSSPGLLECFLFQWHCFSSSWKDQTFSWLGSSLELSKTGGRKKVAVKNTDLSGTLKLFLLCSSPRKESWDKKKILFDLRIHEVQNESAILKHIVLKFTCKQQHWALRVCFFKRDKCVFMSLMPIFHQVLKLKMDLKASGPSLKWALFKFSHSISSYSSKKDLRKDFCWI